MNAKRRKEIERIINRLYDIQSDIESVRDEEQDAYDNLPESLQFSEKGERIEESLSNIEDALQYLKDVIGYLETASE